MDENNKLNSALNIFKNSFKNVQDSFELTKTLVANKNIDLRLKAHLLRILPAIAKTNHFSKESMENTIKYINAKINTEKNDIDLEGCNGYQITNYSKDNGGNIFERMDIVINKRGGVNNDTIAHEFIHALSESHEFKVFNNGYINNKGFRKYFYDNDVRFRDAYGTSYNEGFTEIVTSNTLNNIGLKKRLNTINKLKNKVSHKVNGKMSLKSGRHKSFNPYDFKYDDFDNKFGGGSYTVYKKMAELLNVASDNKAVECFAKGNLDGFMQEFDSVMGNGYCKYLFQTLDTYKYKLDYLNKQNDKYRENFHDKEVTNLLSKSLEYTIDYFVKNLNIQIDKTKEVPEIFGKMLKFEEMLPKNVKHNWDEQKRSIFNRITNRKLYNEDARAKLEHSVALDIHYSECKIDKENLNKSLEYQTARGLKEPNDITMIVNYNGEKKIYDFNIYEAANYGYYDEILMKDINTSPNISDEQVRMRDKFNSIYNKQNPQYLVSEYYKDNIFIDTEYETTVYNISRNGDSLYLNPVELSAPKTIGQPLKNKDSNFREKVQNIMDFSNAKENLMDYYKKIKEKLDRAI